MQNDSLVADSNLTVLSESSCASYAFPSLNRVAYFTTKRIFDLIFGIFGCLMLPPLLNLIKYSFLLTSDLAPLHFTQKRIGKNGKIFHLYKIRTMVPNAEEKLNLLLKDPIFKKQWQTNQKLDHDPRITKIGNFLRKTSLDEFPQFFNLLKGDMSLIGPRPLLPGELKRHKGNSELYQSIRPGITGWWAANGRSEVTYKERLTLEYYYIQNCSLHMDLRCIFKTIHSIIFTKGAK
ncbi:MAG: sugar transferase [Candidatus Saccharibacteria bacterium]|nr:sugar transferase [Candidatus Saccharibacteria bacterium]